tara:strand:- start:1347 stop:1556 length:210 start_codon:yes stop_codon:yes gene_type:complete
MSKIDDLNNKKSELIADLIATSTVMEEVWNYHPDNPNKKDPVTEYENLKQIKSDVEREIDELEREFDKL